MLTPLFIVYLFHVGSWTAINAGLPLISPLAVTPNSLSPQARRSIEGTTTGAPNRARSQPPGYETH